MDIFISDEYMALMDKYIKSCQKYADAKYIKLVSDKKLKKLELEVETNFEKLEELRKKLGGK